MIRNISIQRTKFPPRNCATLSSRFTGSTAPLPNLKLEPQKMQFHNSCRPQILYCAMKPGTEIKGLDIFKDPVQLVAKERSEYPAWVSKLITPPASLAALRKMPEEEATLDDMKRYLKLSRRIDLKDKNSAFKK